MKPIKIPMSRIFLDDSVSAPKCGLEVELKVNEKKKIGVITNIHETTAGELVGVSTLKKFKPKNKK